MTLDQRRVLANAHTWTGSDIVPVQGGRGPSDPATHGVPMKVRYLLVPALLLAVCGGGLWWAFGRTSTAITFRTATIEKKDVQKIVSATGTLTADPSVDVGTQVSGIVADILVDFNSEVEKGQVLARIDTSLLEADVASASARLVEAQASREQLTLALKRTTALHDRQAATDEELEAARADAASAEASVRSAQVTLDRARRNLGYATITAPITGTVVRRDVNRGQTVKDRKSTRLNSSHSSVSRMPSSA